MNTVSRILIVLETDGPRAAADAIRECGVFAPIVEATVAAVVSGGPAAGWYGYPTTTEEDHRHA